MSQPPPVPPSPPVPPLRPPSPQLPPPFAPDAIPYAAEPPRPAVVTWFRVYAAAMALLYFVVLAAGAFFLAAPDRVASPDMPPAEARVFGGILLAMGLVLSAAFAAGLFLPRRTWGWVYALVLIAIGLTSCALWPATIPLLIFWIRPDARAWHGGTR